MAETTLEKAICESCGADVRDGTSFCYNCGKPVAEPDVRDQGDTPVSNGTAAVSPETQAALDELAERFKVEEVTDEDRRAQAAAERKRARVRSRRSEVVWEPAVGPGLPFIVVTLLIFAVTIAVVLIAVIWK